MYPSRITVTKSLTVEKQKAWKKAEFTLEIALDKDDDVETAKIWAESLLDIWITEFEKQTS